jgi:predicted phosphodiesterase
MEYVEPPTHPPRVLDAYLEMLGADILVCGHTHIPRVYRGPRGLVVNPGSVLSSGRADSSRTFAIVDLGSLDVTVHEVATGRALDVGPWPIIAPWTRAGREAP